MRFKFASLLFSLCCFCQAQTLSVFETDSTFFLVTVTEDGTSSSTDTTELGSLEDALQTLEAEQITLANRRGRRVRDLYAMNFLKVHQQYDDIFEQLGTNLDSLRDRRLFARFFVDSVTLVVPVSQIPTGDLLDFTTDVNPTGTLNIDCYFFFNPSGVLRLENIETGVSWKVRILNKDQIEIFQFLGGKQNFTRIELRLRSRGDVSVWRRTEESLDSSTSVRIRYTQN